MVLKVCQMAKWYRIPVSDTIHSVVYFSASMEDFYTSLIKDIDFFSTCEHHLLPFFGKCHVGYIPKGKILGLSKIPRMIDMFARRLQIQENLTQQIATHMMEFTNAEGVGVIMEAQHLCMMMRGVSKQNALMKTSCMLGSFREESATRMEFLSLIGPS